MRNRIHENTPTHWSLHSKWLSRITAIDMCCPKYAPTPPFSCGLWPHGLTFITVGSGHTGELGSFRWDLNFWERTCVRGLVHALLAHTCILVCVP